MKHFRLFNPEHDLALANGDRHFIAPRNIREMACDLAPLLGLIDCSHPLVWGWDSAATTRLLRKGVAAEELPTESALAALRTRSERRTAHDFLYAFRSDNPDGPYIGESTVIRTLEEMDSYVTAHGHIVAKAPLSGSGKGLRHVRHDTGQNKTAEWAEALIRRHGYFTAEPYYTKEQDFAMEFYAADGECRFIGYSLFTTNHHGRYEGNLLMEDDRIEALLSQYVPCTALHDLQAWGTRHSHSIIPEEWDTHRFPLHFGIDMMIVRDGSRDKGYSLHPCVEINLRLNMGIIAHEVRRHLLAPQAEGTFHVSAFPTEEALRTFCDSCRQEYPASYHNGKVLSGYHPLTPIHPHTRHHAYIICK